MPFMRFVQGIPLFPQVHIRFRREFIPNDIG
jgi:hypothetical protein